jgi:hypothetical protein
MTSRHLGPSALAMICLLLAASSPAVASPVIINFDDLAADDVIGNEVGLYPGSQYVTAGVSLRTGRLLGTVEVGGIVTLDDPVDSFEILGGPGEPAISPPNFAIPLNGSINDLLMMFPSPITSVSVTSDNYPGEWPDVIRLLALRPTGVPNQFQVLAVDEKLDDAIASPENLLTVDRGGLPFSYALFETTTEQEGFDDLTMNVVEAVVDLDPDVINVSNRAPWLTAYIEVPGFDPASIDPSTLRLQGAVPAEAKPMIVGDHDANGIPDLMVKFSRQALDPLLTPGANRLDVTFSLVTGEALEGQDEVRVINPRGLPLSASVVPNPLNPSGVLTFHTSRPGPVRVRIFDPQGRLVRVVMDTTTLPMGTHALPVDGRGNGGEVLASGIYFYWIEANEGKVVGRVTILK